MRMRRSWASVLGLLLIILLVLVVISAVITASAAEQANATATIIPQGAGTTTAKPGPPNPINVIRGVFKPSKSAEAAVIIVGLAVFLVMGLYAWFMIPHIFGRRAQKKSFASLVKVSPPKTYDFITYTIDAVDKRITKDYYVKISESLYVSTNLSTPSFLYIPENTETYLCMDGKSLVPCGLAYREGLLTILVDPRLAATHDLARASGLISMDETELDKLLSTLYKKGEKKMQEVAVAPDTRIGVVFDVRNLIKSYLAVLRSADDMMIHFLKTANQSESIERFMKAAARLQETRLSWLRWVSMLVMFAAVAIALVAIVLGGGGG